jgi:hypothetical protein
MLFFELQSSRLKAKTSETAKHSMVSQPIDPWLGILTQAESRYGLQHPVALVSDCGGSRATRK